MAYAALPAIYDVSPNEQHWLPTLDAIVSASTASGALIFGVDQTDLEYSMTKSSTFWIDNADLVIQFMERFGQYDNVGRDFLFRTPRYSVISDFDIWPNENLFEREDFVFSREKSGIFLRAGVNLSPDHGWNAGLIVHFPDTVRQVPQSSREPLAFLAPHLAKSLELRRFVSQLIARYKLVLSVLDKVHIGLCVTNASAEILIANEEAQRILEDSAGLVVNRAKRLVAKDPGVGVMLNAAIDSAVATARQIHGRAGTSLHVPDPRGGEPLFLEVSPLRDSAGEFETAFGGALLTLIDPNKPPNLPSGTLSLLCGFTEAEDAVAALLLEGHPLDTIAEMRAVSINTVKTQTRSIYAKAHVASRGELVRKTAHLNPPIS
ncbi:helix-turn-helix transcriptional regulator [Acuticoccus mangrovi]|uniref:HTH luxR-type domain-containing protein n=1 Tax=Acuticoccus mangrovi TaxID=2796142 RepID=A0A934IKG8_9HYPH|nr:helix-turn-helix transcriptional regulator [Acuticoccus mangrovi]MBJ3778158.1 hypothetical protein [Acuticoccus mangrovi]